MEIFQVGYTCSCEFENENMDWMVQLEPDPCPLSDTNRNLDNAAWSTNICDQHNLFYIIHNNSNLLIYLFKPISNDQAWGVTKLITVMHINFNILIIFKHNLYKTHVG